MFNPEMGQKAKFWNEDGLEMDKVLAIRAENGSRHINFFVRIQPQPSKNQIVEDLSRSDQNEKSTPTPGVGGMGRQQGKFAYSADCGE